MKHEHLWVMCAAASTAVLVIGGAATAAFAQQQHSPIGVVTGERLTEDVRIVRVSYRDLNLAAARDERILNRRVDTATHDVCGPVDHGIMFDRNYSDCVSGAWHGARPQIALAVLRAREIAANGSSGIPLVAIAISAR